LRAHETDFLLRRAAEAVVVMLLAAVLAIAARPAGAATATQQLDLRVLVVDDDSAWIDGLRAQLDVEGIPYRAVQTGAADRPVIDAAFLASGDRGYYQGVILPSDTPGDLGQDELSAIRAYESTFGVREIDAFSWANPALGLQYARRTGDLAGETATVTTAGKAQGFQYLNGPVPFSQGSYAFVAEPLTASSAPPMPSGATFTTLVSAPIDASSSGSILGVYAHDGVEQLVVTAAMNWFLPQFKALAHGMVSWVTRGVHLGYNRNRFTVHVDDAFSEVALWDAQHNCTPGEDCPRNANGESIYPPLATRMTPADVDYAVSWQQANQLSLTLAFNGAYAAADDPLTQSLVANKAAFKWLNHGFEHIYQGCVQDFTTVPWQCATDGTGAVQWVSQDVVYQEITQNITTGNTFGLPFDVREYLSGEHSGLAQLPQQTVDNPNFVAALPQAAIGVIGADASREASQRVVGGATTVPRHPTAVYYNAATVAQEVDEYNWLYTTRADGGSGYCEDNPATATCIAPLDPATGYQSYIVPTDAAFDLFFILSNDPRPFYAHTSNLTEDRILYPLLNEVLSRYRTVFQPSAPLLSRTLTQAAQELGDQDSWKVNGMGDNPTVSGYVQNGQVVITNTGNGRVPLTVPANATVSGATLESYGGEQSGWLPPTASTTVQLQTAGPRFTSAASAVVRQGSALSFTVTTAGSPTPTVSMSGTLPAGVTFTPKTNGTATLTGTPASGTLGTYSLTFTATNVAGTATQAFTLTVGQTPVFTSANTATARTGQAFTFTVHADGPPVPTLTRSGTLPGGLTFTATGNGNATLSGTPGANSYGTYTLTFTATSSLGTTRQTFTLTVEKLPVIWTNDTTNFTVGTAGSFTIRSEAYPTAKLTMAGTLPTGVTFTPNNANGSGVLSGTPAVGTGGTYPLTFTATSTIGSSTQSFTLNVREAPKITSAASVSLTRGQPASFSVTTTGWPVPTVTKSGTMPPGTTWSSSNGTGRITGTPTTAGTWTLTVTAKNSMGTVTQSLTIRVT